MTPADLKTELSAELDRILAFWAERMPDRENGGFIGCIDWQNVPHPTADKGAVLHARILWTFSAAHRLRPCEMTEREARRAYAFLSHYLLDKEYGGVFWSVDHKGRPSDTKKQVYALAFALYALAEYHAAFGDKAVLEQAKQLWRDIETYSHDREKGGYIEAFSRDWSPIDDLRLSEKDANEKKTMNTHLHIAEAYANLYRVAPDAQLKADLTDLLATIDRHFIDTGSGHLRLFFDEDWNEHKDVISYGHDIEAAWLLLDCAEATEDADLIATYRKHALRIAEATREGIDADGGLWYEYDPAENRLIAEKHWWPQAELLLGYHKAWQLTGRQDYLDLVLRNWAFTKAQLLDTGHGEWFWGIDAHGAKIKKDKAGFWKCPYHNGRACIELIRKL